MKEYLRVSEVIDWQHSQIIELPKQIASLVWCDGSFSDPR